MKGVVLCGGLGTRLSPLTSATNKHLLPVYNRPMCFYPIRTLADAGIEEVMVIVSGPHSGAFVPLLKNGEAFGLKRLAYGYQEKPDGGIADALGIAESFANGDKIAVILGDNVTDADIGGVLFQFVNQTAKHPRAHLFLKEVPDPQRFGVARCENNEIVEIVEKPEKPPSNLAVTGLYFYDNHVFDFIKQCEPSKRGELEITDVNNFYLREGELTWSLLDAYWKDAGTFDTLLEANNYWAKKFRQ
jgi:glucose-1-phosphate thymidylyltransferase